MWQEKNNSLSRKYEFPDFAQALGFVNKISELAEAENHHPDIKFGWGYAEVSLTTHSEGKITDKDRKMADAIEVLYKGL